MSAVFPPLDEQGSLPSASEDQEIAKLRTPPHSIEAESSVLGGLLLDNNAWDRVGDLLVLVFGALLLLGPPLVTPGQPAQADGCQHHHRPGC